ncbi:MAG: type II secretion system protein [Patescibacteria group bacterium]|nr:type II secretion system protein [Patescibacteria group bacterium]
MKIKAAKKFAQSGMTLVEMLISMFIFILMMFSSVYVLHQIYKNYGFAMEQGMSVAAVEHSLKYIIEDIRGMRQSDAGAYPIELADDFNFIFYSDVDKDDVTEKVHYYLENNLIKRGISNPSGTPPVYPAEDETVTTLAENVVNTALQPLFCYFNTNYPADQVNNPLATPVSPVADIRLIKMDVYVNLDPFRSPDNIRLESYVMLRNLKDNW